MWSSTSQFKDDDDDDSNQELGENPSGREEAAEEEEENEASEVESGDVEDGAEEGEEEDEEEEEDDDDAPILPGTASRQRSRSSSDGSLSSREEDEEDEEDEEEDVFAEMIDACLDDDKTAAEKLVRTHGAWLVEHFDASAECEDARRCALFAAVRSASFEPDLFMFLVRAHPLRERSLEQIYTDARGRLHNVVAFCHACHRFQEEGVVVLRAMADLHPQAEPLLLGRSLQAAEVGSADDSMPETDERARADGLVSLREHIIANCYTGLANMVRRHGLDCLRGQMDFVCLCFDAESLHVLVRCLATRGRQSRTETFALLRSALTNTEEWGLLAPIMRQKWADVVLQNSANVAELLLQDELQGLVEAAGVLLRPRPSLPWLVVNSMLIQHTELLLRRLGTVEHVVEQDESTDSESSSPS